MPAAVAGWIAVSVGAGAVGTALIHVATAVAFNLALGKILQPKGRSPKDNQLEIRQSNAPRTRYLGRNRVSGALMYADVHTLEKVSVISIKGLWKLWAVAQGGHNGVLQWYIGDDPVSVVDGWVTTGHAAGKVFLASRTGRDAEFAGGAHPRLIDAAPAWTADHRLDGVGTLMMIARNVKAEDAQDIYPGGEPKVTAVISGDSCKNPSGDLGPTQNLARQLYDILIHPDYGPLDPGDMDVTSWNQSISDCNNDVPTLNGGTRRRFEGGGGYQLNEPIKDVAERWCAGMDGTLYLTTDGKVGLRVGRWRDPEHRITEDKIVSMEYGVGADRLDGVGALTPKFVSPELGYQETTADPWEDAAALARWGETATKELPLPVVQHHGQARHLAKAKLARLNPKWRFRMRLRFWGLLLIDKPSVWVDLPRLGIVNEPFWIESFSFDVEAEDGVCMVELIHADPSSLEVRVQDEGAPPRVPPATDGGRTKLEVPTITSVTVVVDDGPPFIRMEGQTVEHAVLLGQYRRSGSTGPWTDMTGEGSGGSLRTLGLEDASQYDVRLAAAPGILYHGSLSRSDWTTVAGVEVIENAIPPDAPEIVAQTGAAGAYMSVTFRPDLGVNYARTGLYQAGPGQPFSTATRISWSDATSAEVTLTAPVPTAGGRYWLQSQNASARPSAAVLVGEYI